MNRELIWRAKSGRHLRLYWWATREQPFCWFAVNARANSGDGRFSCGLTLALMGLGADLSTYWRPTDGQ